MAKVFISHSWNDNDISRKIYNNLKYDGADTWIDYVELKPGEELPKRISQALEWCDTLVVIWSKSATDSYYVGLEWQAALDMHKKIILCLVDVAKRPAILRGFLYIDFKDFSQGYEQLLRALDLEAIRPPAPPAQPTKPVRPRRKLPTQQIFKFAAILVGIVILGLTINYVVQKISSDRAAKEAYRNKWQTDMNTRFQQAQQSDGDTRKSASDKVKIWQQFLTDFAADNRYSQQDNAQRQTATLQQDHWSIEVKREKDQARYEMYRSYHQALQQEKLTSLPAADKATKWQEFLNQYDIQDNRYSQEDNEKLDSARQKKDSWLKEADKESEQVQREQLQAAMTRSYNEAKQRDQKTNLSPDSKIQTWQNFLTSYAEDIPLSQQDNDQRKRANERITYWTNYKPPEPKTVVLSPKQMTVKGMTLVLIRGGTFDMGDTFGDGEADEKPVHSVTVSDFYMGKTEVTNAQFATFLNDYGKDKDDQGNTMIYEDAWGLRKSGNRWQPQSGYENYPVVSVTWYGAAQYAKWAGCRLPTEAEWEYAAREGGKKVRFGNGKNIADPAEINFDGSKEYKKDYSVVGIYRGKTTPVASFKPNTLGLYDMSGNVWEWCWDWYDENYYKNSHQNNPRGSASSPIGARVLRGGSWLDYPGNCRASNRGRYYPGVRDYSAGFRVVQDSPH